MSESPESPPFLERPHDQRFFAPEIETMPREQIEKHREETLLGDLIPWAYERSGLIRETWDAAKVTPADVQSMDDFHEKVPFIDKDAIRSYRDRHNDPYGGLLCIEPRTRGVFSAIFSTSGTTGDPTPAPSAGSGPSFLVREFWEFGCRPGDYFTESLFTFRGPGIHDTIRGIGATPVFIDHSSADVPFLFAINEKYRPTAMYNFSLAILMGVQQHAPAMGVDPEKSFGSYKGVSWAGEPIGPRARRLTDDWGLELFQHTALGDVGAATECREHDGCHYWEDTAYAESLDPSGTDPVEDGTPGELVTSTLMDKIAPLIRYRSDDLVRRTLAPCACGRTHGRVWPLGRKGDEVVVEGRSVLPTDVWHAIELVDETSSGIFQIIRPQREVDVLQLRVGYRDDGKKGLGDLRERVTASVADALGIVPDVELVTNESLLKLGPPHKIPRVTRA